MFIRTICSTAPTECEDKHNNACNPYEYADSICILHLLVKACRYIVFAADAY